MIILSRTTAFVWMAVVWITAVTIMGAASAADSGDEFLTIRPGAGSEPQFIDRGAEQTGGGTANPGEMYDTWRRYGELGSAAAITLLIAWMSTERVQA